MVSLRLISLAEIGSTVIFRMIRFEGKTSDQKSRMKMMEYQIANKNLDFFLIRVRVIRQAHLDSMYTDLYLYKLRQLINYYLVLNCCKAHCLLTYYCKFRSQDTNKHANLD